MMWLLFVLLWAPSALGLASLPSRKYNSIRFVYTRGNTSKRLEEKVSHEHKLVRFGRPRNSYHRIVDLY